MSDQELKKSLCLTMRELYKERILTDIGGNLSFRSSEDPDNVFWITPSGMKKDLVEPEHLIKMSMEGEVLDESELSPSVEWPMHLRIYQEDEDFTFVVHSHAPLATAFSLLAKPPKIPPMTAELSFLVPEIVISPYKQLGESVAELLWDSQTLILENHGVIAVSEESFQHAAIKTRALEEYLQLYLNAMKFGGEIRPFPGFDED
ncbi:MAG: class II aldolase/adducin family protein [Candidatus Hodarchaeales archaeon]